MYTLTMNWEDGTQSVFIDLKLNKALSMARAGNQFREVKSIHIENKQPALPKK